MDLCHYASVDDRADTLRNQIVQADRAGHGAQAHKLFLQDMVPLTASRNAATANLITATQKEVSGTVDGEENDAAAAATRLMIVVGATFARARRAAGRGSPSASSARSAPSPPGCGGWTSRTSSS